jgi:hypothetical protein
MLIFIIILIKALLSDKYMVEKDQIKLEIKEKSIFPNEEIHGRIIINYDGRFDTIVVNSQIENSSDIFVYVKINGKKINYPYSRISIFKSDLADTKIIEFSAISKHVPLNGSTKVKFRTSIIQEHKEIANDIVFLEIRSDDINKKPK